MSSMNVVKLAVSRTACIVSVLLILVVSPSLAQTREKERKPAELQSDTQKSSATNTENEDPQFKGMKYRLVGPFRGGRSLTAAGIAGDPNIYYFGSTRGGGWETTGGGVNRGAGFCQETAESD